MKLARGSGLWIIYCIKFVVVIRSLESLARSCNAMLCVVVRLSSSISRFYPTLSLAVALQEPSNF